MARLAFFTERLPSLNDPIAGFSYDLIRSLADQQHDVRIFATYRFDDELPPPHPRVQILRPFRRWGWLEIPRIVPLLMDFQPDVLHFVQPRAETQEGLTNAMSALPGLGPLIGRPVVVSSFYDLRESDLNRHRWLLMASHAITVSNAQQVELLTEWLKQTRKKATVHLLPVPVGGPQLSGATKDFELSDDSTDSTDGTTFAQLTSDFHEPLPEPLREIFESPYRVVFVPGDISDHRDLESLFGLLAQTLSFFPDVAIVFGGGWGSVSQSRRRDLIRLVEDAGAGARVLITGPLSPAIERSCLAAAAVVFVAALAPESLRLTRILREALAASSVLVASENQLGLDTLPWRHQETAFITGNSPSTWGSILADALASPEILAAIRVRLPEFARLEAVDQPANVMSRIYSRLFAERRPER